MTTTHFTDPGCPWAFSAEPQRLRLLWHYGADVLGLRTRMIELADSPEVYEQRGFTPQVQAGALARIQQQYGMPIAIHQRPRMAATASACRAVVAARLHGDPGDDERLLRALRVRTMAGDLLDEDSTLNTAAELAGLDANTVRGWMELPDVIAALSEDKEAARTPSEAALTLVHKLSPAPSASGYRYSAPSYEFASEPIAISAPGYQSFDTYDAAVASILQDAALRRPAPSHANEVLDWAPYPLATAEVAALRGISVEAARSELEPVATWEQVGEDGYWTPKS